MTIDDNPHTIYYGNITAIQEQPILQLFYIVLLVTIT